MIADYFKRLNGAIDYLSIVFNADNILYYPYQEYCSSRCKAHK